MHFSGTNIPRGVAALAFLFALTLASALPAGAQTETVLYSFCSQPNCADGSVPLASVVSGKKGILYGTTYGGGTYGYGTVFELNTSGTETVLHNFANNGTDGYYPWAGLIVDKNGNLYGTTGSGGAFGGGTVFELNTNGRETILHNFANNGTDGYYLSAGLVMDKIGNLYGTTYLGGTYGYGTIFELGVNGTETILHSFVFDGTDGRLPLAGLIIDKKGNLYGTTSQGGAYDVGTVFKLSADGTETILYSFANNGTDGNNPEAGLVRGTKGNLFGTTLYGGDYGLGTVFALGAKGAETILHKFANGGTDGARPFAGLIRDKIGNLYGMTGEGGAYSYGSVFELSPNGTETVLHSFIHDGTDGYSPFAGLVMDKKKGNLYGTTAYGGANDLGTVFKVTP